LETASPKSDFVTVNGVRLHYLDWGGHGPALVFIPGMGCSAYIFSKFAPRFVDKFHALSLTRRGSGDSDYPETGYDIETLTEDVRQFLDLLKIEKVILVGHSLGYVELTHFSALYPDRVLKLVFLDAAYDYPKFKDLNDDPLNNIEPPGAKEFFTLEEKIKHLKRIRPDLADIWDDVSYETYLHSVDTTSDGKVVDKMSNAIEKALWNIVNNYSPEYSKIQVPTLSIYVIWDYYPYYIPDYLTVEQKADTIKLIDTVQTPIQKKCIEQFRREVPGATIVVIPKGNHRCFIKHEELVYDAMRKFLSE